MIRFRCPGACRCGQIIEVPDGQAGQRIACPHSGQQVPVPTRALTEARWLAATDPLELLRFVPPGVSDRKLRLYAVACCRRVWEALDHPLSRHAVEVAERHAEGQATDAELQAAVSTLMAEYNARQVVAGGAWAAVHTADLNASYSTVLRAWPEQTVLNVAGAVGGDQPSREELAALADLLRDVVGNPFRRVTVDPRWLTWNDNTVLRMAQVIYDEGHFTELPVLADALEEAGCANPDLLTHCRSGEAHVRGCWAVDALLGKY